MKAFRKVLFWLHLIAGIVAGVVILVMSVTGVLLSYERQMIAWADSEYRVVVPAEAKRLPVEELLAKVKAVETNAAPSGVTMKSDAAAPVAMNFGREKTVLVNPYSGAVIGEPSKKIREFFHVTTDLHRWLAAEGDYRATGKAITGACNLAFLFLVVSGLYLWWPKQWTAAALQAITWFKSGLSGKARDWNWHNVIGFWCCIPLFFIVLTGSVFSYPWMNNLVYRITGNEPPPPRTAPGAPGAGGPQLAKAGEQKGQGEAKAREGKRGEGKQGGGPGGEGRRSGGGVRALYADGELNAIWTKAEARATDWQTITLRFPTAGDAPFAFLVDRGNGARPDKRATVNLSAKTGEVVSTETYESYNAGRKLRLWVRWIHTGEAGGFLGQTLAMLASLGGAVLVYTGFALTFRRWRNWRQVKQAQSRGEAAETMAKRPLEAETSANP
ncbi:MAG: PepSY-associated TM helix domain-containing protein [Verrucomicrobiota bacterium]